jgi:hypothetical protein
LARFGSRGGLVAVHVRLDDAQDVLVGHYTDRARGALATVSAAEAVRRIAALEDPRGWEVFVPRAVGPREVHRVRTAPQLAGWRYLPDAQGFGVVGNGPIDDGLSGDRPGARAITAFRDHGGEVVIRHLLTGVAISTGRSRQCSGPPVSRRVAGVWHSDRRG